MSVWMSGAFLLLGICIGVGPFAPQIVEFVQMHMAKSTAQMNGTAVETVPDSHTKYMEHYARFFNTSEQRDALNKAKTEFLNSELGALYGYGDLRVEDVVANEMERFANEIYLDYTGAGVYQKKQLEAQRPKVLFADAVATSKRSILIGELAKILKQNGVKTGQNRLFKQLREDGFLMKRNGNPNMPTQKSMELGLFEVKETSIAHSDGHVSLNFTTKVTPKGQQYLIQKYLGCTPLDLEAGA